ncbi:hypothetical protein LTR36_003627 [Oleoguttula mirabilis]|uniref:Uncharacterized protein n=1 Tax=Oleoguttula mirabilis TaxID=1507867 RepID=A0AAV9JKM3_9PEZI|nr:hypothetical protein LTR36_003627 [Oleoguttula mirabilis]
MARTSWFVGSTRRRLKSTKKKRSSGTTSRKLTTMAQLTNQRHVVGAGLKTTDPDVAREPPPPPTPVTFPVYEAYNVTGWNGATRLPDLQSLFGKVMKPGDISKDLIEALNIELSPPCSVDELLPLALDGTSYLPPLAPQQAMNAASYADATKADPAISRRRKEFDDRLTELRIDNDIAYRTVSRTLKNGTKGPRLAYMRKFWEGLENMSQYWDCSLDHYFEAGTSAMDGEQSAKRQRLEHGVENDCVPATISKQIDVDLDAFATAAKPWSDDSGPVHDYESGSITGNDRKLRPPSVTPEPQSQPRYKGRRTHTGRELPDQFRADTTRAFLEGTVWPFQCSVSPPRQLPTVQFGKLNLPIRQTAAVYRLPRDRARARQGRLEGPMMAMQVRADTDFADESGQSCEAKSRLDLMRELGGLLQIAQERHREGRQELKPGEGKWWTITPRWGGGPGGEVENDAENSDVMQAAKDLLRGIKEAKGKKENDGSRSRRKKTPAMLWKELKCGSARWDQKIDYAAIGKDPMSPYDEVFMVSSLNHHIAILKLTVHSTYVDCLTSGVLPDTVPTDADWCRPKLQRSQWFDLLDLQQRVDALRGLWGVMAYLMREPGVGVVVDASDTTMGGAE